MSTSSSLAVTGAEQSLYPLAGTERSLDSASRVLLTGATGMIGGELALRLAGTAAKVWCLARSHKDETPEARLQQRLNKSRGQSHGAGRSRVPPPHILPVQGDLRSDDLGLGSDALQELIRDTDIIVHAAAETSFIQDDSCQLTNIQGTRQVVALARRCRRPPLLVYISTACNVGKTTNRCLSEDDGCLPDNSHHNEYTRSKAVSEMLVRDSGLPYLIIRPSIVFSAGIDDRAFARQILWFAPLLAEFEALPVNPDSRLDIIPVSFLAEGILELLRSDRRRYDCYNVSAGTSHCHTNDEWFAQIGEFYGRKEPLRLMHPASWDMATHRQYVRTPRQRQIFFGLRYYLPFLNMNVVFDNRRLTEELGAGVVKVPAPAAYLPELLAQITVDEAIEESLLP